MSTTEMKQDFAAFLMREHEASDAQAAEMARFVFDGIGPDDNLVVWQAASNLAAVWCDENAL
jgi:N-acyl-L-homoserine lactone synthetase